MHPYADRKRARTRRSETPPLAHRERGSAAHNPSASNVRMRVRTITPHWLGAGDESVDEQQELSSTPCNRAHRGGAIWSLKSGRRRRRCTSLQINSPAGGAFRAQLPIASPAV